MKEEEEGEGKKELEKKVENGEKAAKYNQTSKRSVENKSNSRMRRWKTRRRNRKMREI